MMIYDSKERTLKHTKGSHLSGEETLYCGAVLHPFAQTLKSYQMGTLTLQEAFTSLLLQSQDFKIDPYLLQQSIENVYGEGSAQEVLDNYNATPTGCKHNGKVMTYSDYGLGFAVSTS